MQRERGGGHKENDTIRGSLDAWKEEEEVGIAASHYYVLFVYACKSNL